MLRQVGFRHGVATFIAAVLLLTTALQGLCSRNAAGQNTLVGHFFDYSFHREVSGTSGEYEDYHDDTYSQGHYVVTDQNVTHVSFHATYSWKYHNNEGLDQQGGEDRSVQFLLSTRRYVAHTDLDEWDDHVASSLAVWFWIPPEVSVGDSVMILDEMYTVTNLDATVWSNWVPKKGIELHAEGVSYRDDDYGMFSFNWKDTYYFDRTTGFIIAERYSEHDRGTWEGKAAEFDWTENLDVTATSYYIPVDYPSLITFWTIIVAILALFVYAGYRARWRTRTIFRSSYVSMKTEVRRVRRLEEFPRLENQASEYFGPFLLDFANKGLLAGDVVAVATTEFALVGLAVYNSEAKIGTILCKNAGITETLRKFVGAKDFFSEVRHEVPEQLRREAASEGVRIQYSYTYNIFETYQVLDVALSDTERSTYDTSLVGPICKEDLPAIEEIAFKVYKVRSSRWLRAQLASKDIGLVAIIDGKVVGFAFATYADGYGRLHTATVLPEYRNRGIGRELLRARLQALRDLGARMAVAEVADWNLPSLHLLWSHGFRSRGTMQVETARRSRIKKNIVRR